MSHCRRWVITHTHTNMQAWQALATGVRQRKPGNCSSLSLSLCRSQCEWTVGKAVHRHTRREERCGSLSLLSSHVLCVCVCARIYIDCICNKSPNGSWPHLRLTPLYLLLHLPLFPHPPSSLPLPVSVGVHTHAHTRTWSMLIGKK